MLTISIEQKGLSPSATKSQIRDMRRSTFRTFAVRWHQRYSAFKFTPAAARKYNYHERKEKRIRVGTITSRRRGKYRPISGDPLVWSGYSRRAARSPRYRATANWGEARYSIPSFNRKPKGFPRGQLRYEFTLVLPSEETALARDAEKDLRSQFKRGRRNITVRRG